MRKAEYIGHNPFPEHRADKVTVHASSRIVRVGDIDTVRQEFQCELYVRLRWEEPHLKGKDISTTSTITWDSYWEPRCKFINAVKLDNHETKKEVRPPNFDGGNPQVLFHYRIKGTFKEVFKLNTFPFDYQNLSITLASQCKSDEMKFVKDGEIDDNIREKNFFAPQEWKLCSHVITEPTTSEEMEGDSQNTYPRYNIRMNVIRQYKYYIYNVLLIMCLFTIFTFSSFAVKGDSYVGIIISLTLLLTTVTFKDSFRQHVPRVSYFTLIDQYTLFSVIFQFFMALRNIISCHVSNPGIMSSPFEKISLGIAVLVFLLVNTYFACLSRNYINNANSRMREDRNKYIRRNPSQRKHNETANNNEELANALLHELPLSNTPGSNVCGLLRGLFRHGRQEKHKILSMKLP